MWCEQIHTFLKYSQWKKVSNRIKKNYRENWQCFPLLLMLLLLWLSRSERSKLNKNKKIKKKKKNLFLFSSANCEKTKRIDRKVEAVVVQQNPKQNYSVCRQSDCTRDNVYVEYTKMKEFETRFFRRQWGLMNTEETIRRRGSCRQNSIWTNVNRVAYTHTQSRQLNFVVHVWHRQLSQSQRECQFKTPSTQAQLYSDRVEARSHTFELNELEATSACVPRNEININAKWHSPHRAFKTKFGSLDWQNARDKRIMEKRQSFYYAQK